MMNKGKVLITGGAGFIGSKLALRLLIKGYHVTVLDSLSSQIHGISPETMSPLYNSIRNVVDFIHGDVTNRITLEKAVVNQNYIVHLAAETGTGQSMYQIDRYVNVNVYGTALLLDILKNRKSKVEKLILGSSRAVYGEGKYNCDSHGIIYPDQRNENDLMRGDYNCKCPICNCNVSPLPTCEKSKANPLSIYGLTKLSQEQYVMAVSGNMDIPAVIFRFQNVYGPGQSLTNPYTGILSIFSTQIRNGNSISIFEDGNESRDFVYIDDVVDAILLGIESKKADNEIMNVGSGDSKSVYNIAKMLNDTFDKKVKINITGKFRVGDIRHNYSDNSKIEKLLGYKPRVKFEEGIAHFTEWVKSQPIPQDMYNDSMNELDKHKLFK